MDNEFNEEDKALIKEMIEIYKVFKMNGKFFLYAIVLLVICGLFWLAREVYNTISPAPMPGGFESLKIIIPVAILLIGLSYALSLLKKNN